MKRLRTLCFFIAILLPALLVGQSGKELTQDSLNLLHKGEQMYVLLPESYDYGYTWHCVFVDSAYSYPVRKISEILDFEQHYFQFEARKSGSAILLFELYKDWEGRDYTIEQKSFPVQVVEKQEWVTRGIDLQANTNEWEDVGRANFASFHADVYSLGLSDKFDLTARQTFIIDLEKRIKGSTWICHISDKEVVRLMKDRFFSDVEAANKSHGVHAFKFETLKPGKALIRFELLLPSGEIVKNPLFHYTIQVKDDEGDFTEMEEVEHGASK